MRKAYSGGRLTCKQIAFWVKETFDKVIDDESIRRILHQNSFSWKKPGTRDYRADPEAQAKFMKELEERMGNESDTRFFFQLTTSTSHTWAPKDKRILLRGQLSRKKLIEMGAVEPETGEAFIYLCHLPRKLPSESLLKN